MSNTGLNFLQDLKGLIPAFSDLVCSQLLLVKLSVIVMRCSLSPARRCLVLPLMCRQTGAVTGVASVALAVCCCNLHPQ